MTSPKEKILALNRVLASRAENFSEKFLESSRAIEFAFSNGDPIRPLGEFAKSIIRVYCPDADLEFVDISSDYFDPIFLMGEISAAAKRLAGREKPILVVAGLKKSTLEGGRNFCAKKRRQYFENLNVVEGFVLRYKNCFPNIEIIFI
ncbi:MAG: hypothetical protein J6P03_04385 [Opitutales bacterium]|nr:hypothetical protein [Opitutales bacterium]